MNLTNKDTSSYELELLNTINSIKQLDMYSVRQLFLQLIKVCFANKAHFYESMQNFPEAMYNYTYSDQLIDPNNKNNKTVSISADYRFGDSADATEFFTDNFKPAIFVCVGDMTMANYGIQKDIIKYLPDNSGVVSQLPVQQRIIISCFGLTYAESVVLSQIVGAFITGVRPKFDNLFSQPYVLNTITSPKCINITEANKMYRSDVVIDVRYSTTWVTKVESVLLKKAEIDFNLI